MIFQVFIGIQRQDLKIVKEMQLYFH